MRSLITLIVAALVLGAAGANAQSKLEIEGGETFDWGRVKPPTDGHLEAVIKMKNIGDKPMKLTQIKPGCGCTKTDPDKFELQPGDVSTMKVKLNISPSQAGPITKSITIRWGDLDGMEALEEFKRRGGDVAQGLDTNERVSFLFLKADVQRAIMMTPSIYFSFQGLEVGKEAQAKLEITNNSDQDITFSDWSADNDMVLNVTGSKTLVPGETMDLVATVVPGLKGQFSGLVTCKTTHPDHPTMEIRAYGFTKESESPVFQNNAK